MTPHTVTIWPADEVPRLGQGRRVVTARVGRKWVRLEDATGRSARVTRQTYDRIVCEKERP